MWDLTLALEELRDDLAETQRKISILELTGRELMAIVDRSGEPEFDPLIRRHLAEIEGRMAMALVRPSRSRGSWSNTDRRQWSAVETGSVKDVGPGEGEMAVLAIV